MRKRVPGFDDQIVGASGATPSAGRYTANDGAEFRMHRVGSQLYLEPLNQGAANFFLDDVDTIVSATRLVSDRLRSGTADSFKNIVCVAGIRWSAHKTDKTFTRASRRLRR